MHKVTFFGKSVSLSIAAVLWIALALILFLVVSVIGLFSLIGHWIWLYILVTMQITIDGKSFSLIRPEWFRNVITGATIWAGFITFWFPTFLIDLVK